jgi:hypothetical protein
VTPKRLSLLDHIWINERFPIERAKETMMLALNGLYPRDTFNVILFRVTQRFCSQNLNPRPRKMQGKDVVARLQLGPKHESDSRGA